MPLAVDKGDRARAFLGANPDEGAGLTGAPGSPLGQRLVPIGSIRPPAQPLPFLGWIQTSDSNVWALVKREDFHPTRVAICQANGWIHDPTGEPSSPAGPSGGPVHVGMQWDLPTEIWKGSIDAQRWADSGRVPGMRIQVCRWTRIACMYGPTWPASVEQVEQIAQIVAGAVVALVGAILTVIPGGAAIGGPLLSGGIALLSSGAGALAGDAAAARRLLDREGLAKQAAAEIPTKSVGGRSADDPVAPPPAQPSTLAPIAVIAALLLAH